MQAIPAMPTRMPYSASAFAELVLWHRLAYAESAYTFTTPEQLIADFQRDIERWNDENRDS